jgi:hypothetical protein
MRRRPLFALLVLAVPNLAAAQLTYEQRAALAKNPVWQDRVGIAAQQQAVVAQGENPATCCQISTQEALVARPGKTLCDLSIPAGKPGAPAYLLEASAARHAARATLAGDVLQSALQWSQRMSALIASDQCVLDDKFTDAQLQSYMIRLWDLYALTPALAAAPVPPPSPPVMPGSGTAPTSGIAPVPPPPAPAGTPTIKRP